MFKLVLVLWLNGVSMQDTGWFASLEDCKFAGEQASVQNSAITYVCIPDHKPKYK